MSRLSSFKVYAMLLASVALWGGTWVAGRVVAQSVGPYNAAFIRFLLATTVLVAMCWRAEGVAAFRPARHNILPLILLGLTGVFGYSSLFFAGLKTVSAGRAALIVGCIPVAIALSSALIHHERLTVVSITGILCSLVGVWVVISDGDPVSLLMGGVKAGDVMILGCVVCWTAYTVIGQPVMKELPALTVVTWSCIFGTILLLPFSLGSGLWQDVLAAGWVEWTSLVYLGVFATSFAYYWYYLAIRDVGVIRSGIFINLVPIFGLLFSCLLLDEPLPMSMVGGGALVISGVCVTIYGKSDRHMGATSETAG